jgi:protein gp37
MAENSKIEWTDHTANLWWGCTEVHAGCDNCYARVFSHRYDGGNSLWGAGSKRRAIKSVWNDLAKYQRLAKEAGTMHRVFVGSMMDIFEKSKRLQAHLEHHTVTDSLRQELFTQITWGDGGLYPNLMFLFLTKRPSNIAKMVPAGWLDSPPPNVMYGYSAVDKSSWRNVNDLRKVNGKRFLSVEPQLEDLGKVDLTGIDWVIQGGESGHGRRPFNLDWARSMRDQCAVANVPYFFKQIDKIQPIPEDLQIRQFPI